MSSALNRRYVYFMYSSFQYKDRLDIERKIGKTYIPGQVVYKGKKFQFTEIVEDVNTVRYSDAKIVAEGYIDEMQYTDSKHVWGYR